MRDFFDPPTELQNVVLVSAETLRRAQRLIIGCEGCSPDGADLPFDNVLDCVTGNDPEVTNYLFVECAAKCPNCRRAIGEKTLIELG
jgi:hypothetical protein